MFFPKKIKKEIIDMASSAEKVRAFVHSDRKLLETSLTLRDIFQLSMSRNPHAPALIYFDESGRKKVISYNDYKSQAFVTASKLSSALSGVPAGTVIALKLKNTPKWPILFWSILMNGHTPLLIDAKLPKANAENLISQAKAKAIITNDEETFSVPSFRVNDIASQQADYGFSPDWADHVIFCSSGTTGDAKMMVFDGKNLCQQLLASQNMGDVTLDILHPGTLNLLAMIPFHHIFGFVAVFLWYTYYGGAIVFPSSMASNDLLYAVRKGKVTHLYAVPLFWDSIAQMITRKASMMGPKKAAYLEKMIAYQTHQISKKEAGWAANRVILKLFQGKVLGSQIQFCISGGGYLSSKTLNLINGLGYPLYNGYGMTEIGITSVELSPQVEQRLKGSIGKPLAGVEYKIVPLSKESSDRTGELYVKSGITHEREFIGGVLTRSKLVDGFYKTGDIAYCDEQGYYFIKGRLKDTIILANGENVYPDEIEFYFHDVKHVNNCVVLGVTPKGEKDEKIALVLEVDNSVDAESLMQIKKDIDSINASLPNEKKVQAVYVDKRPLPMANNMKVKRFVIKEGLEQGSTDFIDFEAKKKEATFEGYDPEEVSQYSKEIGQVFAKILVLPEFKIDGQAHWINDLGGDSMSYIEMVQELEKKYGVTVPDSCFGVLTCRDDFVKEIIDLKHGKGKDGAAKS
jgi:long-subunit acyl-CoA synthetase (AMP-forming)